jgi:hypothetical protein
MKLELGSTYLSAAGKKVHITNAVMYEGHGANRTSVVVFYDAKIGETTHWLENDTYCCGAGSSENRLVAKTKLIESIGISALSDEAWIVLRLLSRWPGERWPAYDFLRHRYGKEVIAAAAAMLEKNP